jgi:CAAX protease family protein
MNTSTGRRTILFFVFALLFSWAIWIPMAVAQVYVREAPWLYLMMLGGLSPSLVGIIFLIRHRTYTKREFVRSFLSFRQIGLKRIGVLVLCIAVPFGLSLLIDNLLTGHVPSTTGLVSIVSSPVALIVALLTFVYSGPITEEFGWRGFATRELLPRLGLVKLSLLIGTIWSVWHYPLFFLNGQYSIDNYLIYIPVRLVRSIGLTTIITFFYMETKGSVLSAMMIHLLANAFAALFLPVELSATAIQAGLLVILAVVLVVVHRTRNGRERSQSGSAPSFP